MNSQHFKRALNFTPSEKQFLLNLVAHKYHNILEDKKTNHVTVEQKNKT